jgi:hypothetical protein
LRERWFGATRRRVPALAVEGDPAVPVDEALLLDDVSDVERLRAAHDRGTPVVVRARDEAAIRAALARPEVASVLVPADRADLLELDLTNLTYGERGGTHGSPAGPLP